MATRSTITLYDKGGYKTIDCEGVLNESTDTVLDNLVNNYKSVEDVKGLFQLLYTYLLYDVFFKDDNIVSQEPIVYGIYVYKTLEEIPRHQQNYLFKDDKWRRV